MTEGPISRPFHCILCGNKLLVAQISDRSRDLLVLHVRCEWCLIGVGKEISYQALKNPMVLADSWTLVLRDFTTKVLEPALRQAFKPQPPKLTRMAAGEVPYPPDQDDEVANAQWTKKFIAPRYASVPLTVISEEHLIVGGENIASLVFPEVTLAPGDTLTITPGSVNMTMT